jgi:O-antigen/teichoic acid export membrane protein
MNGRMTASLQSLVTRIRRSELLSRMVSGAFWSTSGAIVLRVLGLASSILIARIVGKVSFGELGILQGTVGMFTMFAGFGMSTTATKYVAELRSKDPERAGRIVAFSRLMVLCSGLIVGSIFLLLAPWLATRILAAPQLTYCLRVSSLVLFLGIMAGLESAALAGLEAFRKIAYLNWAIGLLTLPVTLVGVLWGGVAGVVWAWVILQALSWALYWWIFRIEGTRWGVHAIFRGCVAEKHVLWSFGLPSLLISLVSGPIGWLCSAILVNQANGYAEMGAYNAANQWRAILLFLPGNIGIILLPILANLRGTGEQRSFEKVLWYNVALNAAVTFLFAVLIIVGAPVIMAAYGKGFETGVLPLILLAASSIFIVATDILGRAIASLGRMWWGLALNTIWAMVMLLLAWAFKSNGATGLSLANLVAYSFHFLVSFLFISIGLKIGFGRGVGTKVGPSILAKVAEDHCELASVVSLK